jgi:hypothetical protein
VLLVWLFFLVSMPSMLGLVPSCGLTLLRAPQRLCDYTLVVDDGAAKVKVLCHRAVLAAHSEKLAKLMTAENYFDMSVRVKPGYLGAMVELLQYMYLKDPALISDQEKLLQMCGLLHMKVDHFVVSRKKLRQLNEYPTTQLTLQFQTDQRVDAAVLAEPFQQNVAFSDLASGPAQPKVHKPPLATRKRAARVDKVPHLGYTTRSKHRKRRRSAVASYAQ